MPVEAMARMDLGASIVSQPSPPPAPTRGSKRLDQWYVAREGKVHGPYPREHVRRSLHTGEIDGETLVWRRGMPEWTRAADALELSSTEPDADPLAPAPTPVPQPVPAVPEPVPTQQPIDPPRTTGPAQPDASPVVEPTTHSDAPSVPAEAWRVIGDRRHATLHTRDGRVLTGEVAEVLEDKVTLVADDGSILVLEKADVVHLKLDSAPAPAPAEATPAPAPATPSNPWGGLGSGDSFQDAEELKKSGDGLVRAGKWTMVASGALGGLGLLMMVVGIPLADGRPPDHALNAGFTGVVFLTLSGPGAIVGGIIYAKGRRKLRAARSYARASWSPSQPLRLDF
jgi:hypothetical protein